MNEVAFFPVRSNKITLKVGGSEYVVRGEARYTESEVFIDFRDLKGKHQTLHALIKPEPTE